MPVQTDSRWTILHSAGRDVSGELAVLCRCRCGTIAKVRLSSVRSGNSKSCGCLNRELSGLRAKASFSTHGHCPRIKASHTYLSWQSMIHRCKDSKGHPTYVCVRVCARWRLFPNFLADMGERPKGTTLGRFLDTGDYKKSNCAWMTRTEQAAEARKKRRLRGHQRT